MLGRFDASLDGVSLTGAVPQITIIDITYAPAQINVDSMEKASGFGVIPMRKTYREAGVAIMYDLSIYRVSERQYVHRLVQEWAMKGGKLRTSDREGQFLNVRCQMPPAFGSALRWTDPMYINFIADAFPLWQDEEFSSVTISNNGTLYVPGIREKARVSATITPSGTLTTMSVGCGDTQMSFTGLNTTGAVIIDYDSNGFLTIHSAGGADLMQYRSGSDELLALCGSSNSVSVSGNVPVSAVIKARGLWT